MPEAKDLMSLPFIIRKMLQFDFAASFLLEVDATTIKSGNFYVTGATRSGTFSYKCSTAGVGTTELYTFQLNDVPLYITISDTDNNFVSGQLYTLVSLKVNGAPAQVLCSGYVYDYKSISWPITFQENSQPDHNVVSLYDGPNPAAGAEAVITVPANELWHVKAVNVTLVASAAVADRYTRFIFGDGTYVISASLQDTAQTASQTRQVCAIAGNDFVPFTSGTNIIVPLPMDIWLGPGETIKTVTANLQAGDNYGVPSAIYRQYLH